VLVTGDSDATWGAPARAYSAQRDAVAVKLTGTGALAWNTFLGGTGTDIGYGIFPDGGGDVYVAGSSTSSWGSPILAFGNDNQYDAFVSSIWAADPPVVSVPGAQSLSEDGQRIFSSGNGNRISIGDPDIGASADEVTLNVAHGTLTLAGTAGLTFSAGDGTADATMTFRGSISAINTALWSEPSARRGLLRQRHPQGRRRTRRYGRRHRQQPLGRYASRTRARWGRTRPGRRQHRCRQ
jgi:hypothetical protein